MDTLEILFMSSDLRPPTRCRDATGLPPPVTSLGHGGRRFLAPFHDFPYSPDSLFWRGNFSGLYPRHRGPSRSAGGTPPSPPIAIRTPPFFFRKVCLEPFARLFKNLYDGDPPFTLLLLNHIDSFYALGSTVAAEKAVFSPTFPLVAFECNHCSLNLDLKPP